MLKYCIRYCKVAKRVSLKSSRLKNNLTVIMNFTLIKALCYIPETVTCKLYLNLKTEFSNMPQKYTKLLHGFSSRQNS